MITFDKLLLESIDEIDLLAPGSTDIISILDQPKSYSINNTVELTELTGKNDVTLGTLEKKKATAMTFSNGYVLMSTLGAQLGSEVEMLSAETSYAVPELLRVEVPANATQKGEDTNIHYVITLPDDVKPEGESAVPTFSAIYKANEDGSQGERFEMLKGEGTEYVSGSYIYDNENNSLELPASFEVGDTVLIPYMRKLTSGQKITNNSTGTSKNVRVIAHLTAAHVCDQNEKYHVIFDMPQGKLDGNSTLDFGSDGTYPEITVNAIANVCSKDKELFSMYVID